MEIYLKMWVYLQNGEILLLIREDKHKIMYQPLSVIAAVIALPVVNEKLQSINRQRPAKDAFYIHPYTKQSNDKLDAEAAPWIARRNELIAIIRGDVPYTPK